MDIVEFAERFLGCKLLEYQKIMLREFDRKRRSKMVNCSMCFHKEVCGSKNYVENNWTNCPSYIPRVLVTVHMSEEQLKEATAHLNHMCEDLLTMRKRLENKDTSIRLYEEIMSYRKEKNYDERSSNCDS